MSKILITGASGFVGSHLVDEALERGFETWAGVRNSSSRAYLKDGRIGFLCLDTAKPDVLRQQLDEHVKKHGAFDYVVHCAGVTKCADPADFDRVNYQQTRHLVEALEACGMKPRLFVFISTLSVFGPIHEADYSPIVESDEPQPNTAYGRSKLKAERYLQGVEGFPYVILRPTGVYGPREKDYFVLAQSIRRHLDFAAGFRRQDLTFVYVKDVAQAVFLAIGKGISRRTYFLSDGAVYSSRIFSDLLREELGRPWLFRFTCPLWLLKLISSASGELAARCGKSATLNADKYRIMKQRNWRCDITPAQKELGYRPAYTLERGVKETVAWYKKEGWI